MVILFTLELTQTDKNIIYIQSPRWFLILIDLICKCHPAISHQTTIINKTIMSLSSLFLFLCQTQTEDTVYDPSINMNWLSSYYLIILAQSGENDQSKFQQVQTTVYVIRYFKSFQNYFLNEFFYGCVAYYGILFLIKW